MFFRRIPRHRAGTWAVLSLLTIGACATSDRARLLAARVTRAATQGTDALPRGISPARLQSCDAPTRPSREPARRGSPEARAAAQRGIAFVSREAVRWQQSNNCYGCHVQAVTFEALTVGRAHRYDVSEPEFREVLRGLTDINGGHRRPGGLSVGGSGMPETSRLFGAAAFARYDATAGDELRDDLLAVAGQLLAYQGADGAVRTTDTRFPVVAGELQAATQALQAWRQAYSRTADERWLAPLRATEAWMQAQARRMTDAPDANTVHLNYAVMGLLAAGAQPGEATLRALASRLRERQRADGAWGFSGSDEPNAFATGQSLHALRSLGYHDDDPVVARGTAWLIARQGEDGGWSHEGRGKAEAMWAVFGLVSIDAVSLALEGVRDGQHASGTLNLEGRASDNQGAGVAHVDVLVDDIPVARGCGDRVSHALNVSDLAAGVHSVDLVATDARGGTSRRRTEFYTGRHYLTRAGARFGDGATTISLRDVAPADVQGTVEVKVFATEGARRGAELWRASLPSAQGPMQFRWDGRDTAGTARPNGRYEAELVFRGRDGAVAQTVALPFVHDTPEAQRANFAEVEGRLNVQGGSAASNTVVELVDDRGRVLQQTTTTEQGNYRFRNVDRGQYRVRVRRQGFRPAESAVSAAPAATSRAASMELHY